MRYLFTIIIFLTFISVSCFAEDKVEEQSQQTAVAANTDTENKETGEKAEKNNSKEDTDTKLASVEITGVDSDLKKNIELLMPLTVPECLADRADVRQFFNTAKKQMRKATRALGYYDAEFVSGGSIINGCWKLRLRITPGLPTKVIGQTIKVVGVGNDEKEFKEILKEFPYKNGDILNHQKYTDYKAKLSEVAQVLGYFDAEFEQHNIRVDPISRQATVFLVLNTGSRYKYGEVTVDQKVLSNEAINKYISIKKGAFYKAEDLITQQQVLQRSGYFKTINIDVLHQEANNLQVPVKISLTRKKRNVYKFKVGYGSDTGSRIAVEMNRRYLGKSGKQLKFKTQFSENIPEFSIQLLNPRNNPEDNSLIHSIDLKQDSNVNDDIESQTFSAGSTLVRKFKNGWVRSASLTALKAKTQVNGEEEIDANLLLFGVGLEKVKTDNLLYPTRGWRIKLSLDTAFKAVLSDQNVTQLKMQAKGIKQIGSARILTRMNLGTSIVSDFDSLPESLRFFAGGSNSVRGYSYKSLGEVNNNGKNIGGKQLLDLSLEYQHPINKTWSAAAFVDAGNAFDSWDDYSVKVGVGFGVRWKSPVGPVKVDIGFPKDDFKDPKLHLSIGSDL